MRFSKQGLGLASGLIVLSTGCPSSDGDATTAAQETGSADDDADDDGGSGTTMAAGSGTAMGSGDVTGAGSDSGSSSDDAPVADGGLMFECPEDPDAPEATFTGTLLISGDDPSGMPIEVLDGIAKITGDLLIDNTDYEGLAFLSCIVEVQGDIQIFDNTFLVDLSGTNNIVKVGRLPALNPTPQNPNFVDEGKGSISISNNAALPDLNGFASLTQIGEQDTEQPMNMQLSPQSLVIRKNGAMTDFTGFNSLALIYASLIIQENDVLTNIDGLSNLQGVGAAFSVTRNPELCISSVNAIGGNLDFLGEPENSTTTQNNDDC